MKTIADRPVVRGLPVPYVARWTGEHANESYRVAAMNDGQQFIRYAQETPFDRDKRGVLWMREYPMNNGTGVPEFGEVSSYRQRHCMENKCCQVCGETVVSPFRFLMIPVQMMMFEQTNGQTENPPVCEACAEAAPQWCPAIKKGGFSTVLAEDFEPCSYLGEVAFYREDDNQFRRMMSVAFDRKALLAVTLARQLSVQLKEYRTL